MIPAGGIAHGPAHLIDVLPTCLEVAGATYLAEHAGHATIPLEGESPLPLFRGDPGWTRRLALCCEREGNRAVRQGRWKLVSKFPGPWELCDLDRDWTELHDLTAQHPAKAAELAAIWDAWAARCGVVPWEAIRPGRRY